MYCCLFWNKIIDQLESPELLKPHNEPYVQSVNVYTSPGLDECHQNF